MNMKHHSTVSAPVIRGGGKTLGNTIHRGWLAAGLGALFFASLTAFSPSPARAQCEQWDISGDWEIVQSNGNRVAMILSVNGTKVTGTARDIRDLPEIPVTGTMVGNKFNVTVYWKRGNVGVYRGTVDAGGGMKGTTYDKANPGVHATWYSNRSMVCADADVSQPIAPPIESTNPTPPRPPPLKSTGHMPANPTPSRPPPLKSTGHMPKTQSPTISANPIAVTVPDGESRGATTLTWNAGPDHPDAQVLMKVGIDGEETLVAGRGKGTRRVSVERGKNYQFILTDSGQQLAKAVVISKR
jgi:hypothetical protein